MIVKEIPFSGVGLATPHGHLSIAAVCTGTHALGPGWRSVVWVQGCPIHCKGCIAPDWIPFRPALSMLPKTLADELLFDPLVTGITISGGEPMMQAQKLAYMVEEAKAKRPIDVIVYSGYKYETLLRNPPAPGVHHFLELVDVLIDGPYIETRNDNLGIRGSDNQNVYHFSDKLIGHDFKTHPRSVELSIQNGQVLVVGVPDIGLLQSLDLVIERSQEKR